MGRRPNILFLIADDHRHDLIGTRHPVIRTPALDWLAAQGTLLTHHYCQGGMNGAICAPSRAEILSGRELFGATAASTPGEPGTDILNPDVPTLPETFREHRYHTHAIGKWHNGRRSFHRSFDSGSALFFGGMSDHQAVPVHDFEPNGRYPESAAYHAAGFSTDVFADAAVDFLTEFREKEPFFCWVAFTAPHDPRTPPPEFARLYSPNAIDLPDNFRVNPVDTINLVERDEGLAALPRDPVEVRRHIAEYYGMISHLDHGIGRILDAMKRARLLENTIVVYTSDHGLAVGQHGLMGKQNLFDHSLRVPLILAGPGVDRSRVLDELTLHADLFPTLAGLAEVEIPSTVQGCDFSGLLDGSVSVLPHKVVHSAYLNRARAATDGHHKIIRNYEPMRRLDLYDLLADPGETHSLAGDPALSETVARLSGSLDAWQQWSGDQLAGPAIEDKSELGDGMAVP